MFSVPDGGNIAALRAAVAAQAILTFDDKLQVPRDMSGVPVMVQELTGSHYTTIQMLESAVGSQHVKIQNGGLPQGRYAALKDGTARAIAVMEPFISFGLKTTNLLQADLERLHKLHARNRRRGRTGNAERQFCRMVTSTRTSRCNHVHLSP